MKIMVMYYTFDRNTQAIAEAINETVGGDIVKLVRVNEFRRYGWQMKRKAKKEVKKKKAPDIFPFKWDPRDYDLIFIGTPVWYDSYNPVYNTLFNVIKIYDRKIALFSSGEFEETKALDKFETLLQDSVILGKLHLVEPIWCLTPEETQEELDKARSWAKDIVNTTEEMLTKEDLDRRKVF